MTTHHPPGPPLKHAAACQMLGALLTGGLILLFPVLLAKPLALAVLQGSCAALASYLLRDPVWWLPIHFGFMPLAMLALGLGLPSWVWLAGFIALLLVFWRTDRSRVPLYLTNAASSEALIKLLPAAPGVAIDLGCGDGGLLRRLAQVRPDCRFVGFEHAPLMWAWARLRCRGLANVEIRFGDFWSHPLGDYALVYAFLSPVPMQRLWIKARAEMKTGAKLVSNSFAVPDIRPESTVEVADARQTRLYCYEPADAMPGVPSRPDGTGTYPAGGYRPRPGGTRTYPTGGYRPRPGGTRT